MTDRKTMDDLGYTDEWSLFGGSGSSAQPDDTADGRQRQFLGLYKAGVVMNADPEFRGRLFVEPTDVTAWFPSSWAEPCVPIAGPLAGQLSIPPIGAGVFVEFLMGNPDHPVWMGGQWGSTIDAPPWAKVVNPAAPGVVTLIQTMGQDYLAIADPGKVPLAPAGGIVLSAGDTMLVLDKTGIRMFGKSVFINGAAITFNGGAMLIMA